MSKEIVVASEFKVSLAENWEDREPRVRDIDLAVALGFDRPRNIRTLIERCAEEAEFGAINYRSTVKRQFTGNGASRDIEVQEAWLTERQALRVITRCDTAKAHEASYRIIDAFINARKSSTSMQPTPWDGIKATLAEIRHQSERVDAIRVYQLALSDKVDGVSCKVDRVERRIDDMASVLSARRQEFTDKYKREYRSTIIQRYNGMCPCCKRVKIVESLHGNTTRLVYDHWWSPNRAQRYEGWPVCDTCNQKLGHAGANNQARREAQCAFESFQRDLNDLYPPPGAKQVKLFDAN